MKRIPIVLLTVLCLTILPLTARAATYSDVPSDYWAYTAIERAYSNNVMAGTSAKGDIRLFSPGDPLTKAQFLTVLCRAAYPDALAASTAAGVWYADALDVATQHHLLDGAAGGASNMNMPINRYTMAVLMKAVLDDQGGLQPASAELAAARRRTADFEHIPERYQDAVATVVAKGWITGVDSTGRYSGDTHVSRAQAAVVYDRMFPLLTSETTEITVVKDGWGNKVWTARYRADDNRCTASITVPHTSRSDSVGRKINAFFDQQMAGWKDTLIPSVDAALTSHTNGLVQSLTVEAPETHGRLWIFKGIYDITGSDGETYNCLFDNTTGSQLALEDLFTDPAEGQSRVEQEVLRQIQELYTTVPDKFSNSAEQAKALLQDETFRKTHVLPTKDGLYIQFERCTIADGTGGALRFLVPWSLLNDLVKLEYSII